MNITIYDCISFLRKNFLYAILIVFVSSSAYFVFNNFKSKTDILSFEVDLREWENLNVGVLPWLKNYKHYPNEIKYTIVGSFEASAKCKTDTNVSNVLFCSVKGSQKKLDLQFSNFEETVNAILSNLRNQIIRDLDYFENRKKIAQDFLFETSDNLKKIDEILKMADFNYLAFNKISEMEKNIEILNRVSYNFENTVIVKNRSIKIGSTDNIIFYTFLCAMLSLFLYVIIGVTVQSSSKSNIK